MRLLLRSAWQRVQYQVLVWISEHRISHGIPVMLSNNRAHASTEDLFAKLEAALALIAQYRPRTLRRMQRDLSLIRVDRFAVCRAIYYPDSRTCRVDSSFVALSSTAAVASSLVHEGVHARIRRHVRRWPPNATVKEERICRHEELRFGRAIPGGYDVARRAEVAAKALPAQIAPSVDWLHANRRAARIRLRETRLLPQWLKQPFAHLRGLGSLRQAD